MADLFRPTNFFDIKDKAEVLLPLKEKWGRADVELMPTEYRERLIRFMQTRMFIFGLRNYG